MKKRVLSLLLALVMAFSLMPTLAFAANTHDGEVRVIISNDTYPEAEGAPWEGTLVDEWVEVNDDSTMMSCVVAALDNNGYEQSGAENNYISTINGLSEFDGGGMSGWMGTLNDWFTSEGFGCFSVATGNFGAGDEIHIMYTCAYGDDLGGSWGNTDTRIDSIKFSAGSLNKDFSPESDTYTLTLPAGTTKLTVQPTAANKNYMVRIFLNDYEEGAETHYGDYEYKRNDAIPVANGDTIYVGCGLPNWPSMNQESDGGHVYAFKVVIPEAEQKADYKTVLNNTLAQLAATVSNPAFGTGGGEWSVLSLARGGYFAVDDPYFETYYSNVEKTVPDLAETAAGKGVKEGGLDKNKSTENSRLILALAAIGKDPTNVGGVNVLGAYDANGFNWIKKQGINGPIFTLIALDTKNYPTKSISEDGKTIREQCVDFILSKELENGGWALSGTAADPDITSMALQALVKYKDQTNVAAAANRAFAALSNMQKDDGGFASWGSVNSESIAQVITALSAWGIDADKDSCFVKDNGSALDALLTFYIPEGMGFAHVLTSGGGYTGGEVNGMATDQAAYALVAYDRFVNEKTALYDMSDVKTSSGSGEDGETKELTAALTLPEKIENKAGTSFNAVINLNGFPEDYRLLDSIITIPEGVAVKDVTMGSRIGGGEVSWYVEEETGKLRIVYFDADNGNVMTDSGTTYPLELMTIGLALEKRLDAASVSVSITGMTAKKTSESETQIIIDTASATDTAELVKGISFSVLTLYTGDDIDLIPSSKTAIAVAVTGVKPGSKLVYDDGSDTIEMKYNAAVSEKTGVSTYLAIIASDKAPDGFVVEANYTITEDAAAELIFGDTNNNGVINAQDALNSVNFWLRKVDAPDDDEILATNVTCDSRINTFDALGIVENFVDGSEFAIVTTATADSGSNANG